MPIDDEDLFDAPAQPKKPSNKIVYQPADAQWSLDRLGEVESLYQTSFKKKLPLANRGQGSIHNRFGYDHRNSADVSLNPSSPEGQQFVEQLKKANVPFLAFSSAIPGVSTGPHIHLGFPSKRSQQKFNVGSQRKKKHVASEDLFDKDDDDLFDSMEQNPPSTSEQRIQPAESTAGRSAPSMPRGRFVLAGKGAKWARPPAQPRQPRSKLFQQLGQQRTVDQIQRQQEQAALDEAKADLQSERGPYGAPTGRGILRLFSSPFSKFGELAKSDEQIIQDRAQEKLKAQRIAQDPEVTESRKAYGQMSSGRRIVQRPLEKAGASILQTGGGLASGFGIAPNQLSDWMNRRGQLIESAASLPPLAEEQTLSSLITGEKELKEVDVGAIEKIATGVTDLGLGLGQIILLKRASKLSFPNLLALEAAAKNSDKPASEQAARAAEGYALGQGLERLTSRAANAALSGIPTAAQTGYEVAQGRMSPLDAAIQTGIQTGVGAILPPAKPRRGTVEAEPATPSLGERIARRNAETLPPEIAEAANRYTKLSDEMVRLNNEYSDATRNNLSESEVDALLRRHRELVLQQRPLEAQIADAGYKINPIGEVVREGETFPSVREMGMEGEPGTQETQPTVPERGETVQAQIDSGRPVVLITPGTPRPKLPQGMRAEKTSEGVFYYDPTQIDVRMIRGKVADGTFGELLGHVEPKSESTTEAVVARDAKGNEIQSSAVSPENVDAQAEVLRTQYPEAQVETGGPELAQEVIAERTEPQVETKEAEIVKPWEMTRKQIEEEFQRRKAEDDNVEAAVFGPELAKKYNRLQRIANSSTKSHQETDAAYAEVERMEAALSERDRNKLYGIGEEGPQLDDLRDYRQSLGNLDDHDPQSLAESMRWAVSRVGKKTDPAKMTHDQQVAYGTLREAARIAHERGWDTQAISREAVRAAGERFSDPEDAAFMLDRFIKKSTKPESRVRQALPSAPEPQRFYHRDFGKVIKTESQEGARAGRTRVQEADNPDAIHYVKTAQLTGAGNQRMVPVKPEPSTGQEQRGGPTVETPAEVETPETATLAKDQGETGKLGGYSSPSKTLSLSQFVRKRGGIVPAEMYKGELDRLRRKDTGTTGLINQNARQGNIRQTADIMMQSANDAGFRDKNGQPFENPGDFLRAVERDVAGEKTFSTLRDTDAEIEQGLARYYADQQAAHDAEVARTVFLESGRGADLFDKIVDRKANNAEREEYLQLAERAGISRAESEDLIAAAREEAGELQETRSERPATPRAEQLGFVQEGLTQQQASLPRRGTDQRERLIREEQDRQAQVNPERTVALAKLEEIRRRGMTVEDYARQPDLLGNTPDAKEVRLLRELERSAEPEPTQQRRLGEEGFINVSPEKAEYKPATTPVLKDVERATLDAENRRPSLRQFGRRATSYLQRALVAEFTPLRELEAKLYGKENVPVVNMARKFEQVAGAPAKAQADVIDFRRAVVDPIRKHADDFNSYLFLKRVEDRLGRDPERKKVADWSIEKARTGLEELKAKVGDETYRQLEAAGDAYQKEMDKALRLQVESGRMSEDLYEQIVNSRDFYAPFKVLRHIEESEFLKGTGRRVATTQDLTKKIAGIEKEDFQLGNILQASAEQIVRSRILAEKNLKMLELDKLADLDPKGDLIRRVEKDDERPKQGYQFVRLLKDGKEKILEVEDVVADAVQGLNPKQASLLSQVMAMARRPLQLGATSANAGFQAVNLFFADLPRQALVSRYGVKSAKDLYQFPLDWTYSLLSSIKGNFGKPNQLYMDWLRSGAANSTVQRELTPEAFRPTLGIAKPGVKNLASSALNSVAKFSNAIEETSKILGLKRGMKAEQIAKMSPAERQQAMEKIAAEVRNYSGSPDFARRGSETRELNLLFMFFNARLQGITSDLTRLAGKTGKKEGAVAWARLGTAIGIPTTLLALLNNSDEYKEDYAKIPDWEKKSYWMIPRDSYFTNDDGEQIRDYWRIPKRELGQLFGNTIESAVEFAYKRDPKTAKQWSIDMLENLSPINLQGKTMGERAESAFSGLNPALKLPAEAIMNRDTFRHRDIVPEYMRKAKPSEQYRESTPRPYRVAGKALGVSPLQLEHAVEGATGSAVSQFNIRPQPEGRSQLAGYPIARRFFRSGSVAKDESLDQAQQDVATKQLERRRARQEAIKKYRAGQISKEELDRLESEDVLTESDVKRVEKEAGMTPRQVNFHSKAPVDALVAYERMTPAQRDHVKDIMARKAYTLLHSEALTETQKAEFEQRINQLGITPEAPKRQSTNPFKQRFSSSFK